MNYGLRGGETWSEESRRSAAAGVEASRRSSGAENLLLALVLLWPSAAPVNHKHD